MPEISVNHTDLGAAILHCPFLEISDIICVWAQPFFIVNIQKSGISYEFGCSHSSLSISRNQGYHMNLSAAILHCQYAQIRDNHMGLGAAILHCQYAEICDKHMGLGAAFPHFLFADIFVPVLSQFITYHRVCN
jgi:hypothetical protein